VLDPRTEAPAPRSSRPPAGSDPLITGTGGSAGGFRRSRPVTPVADPMLAALPSVDDAPAPAAPAAATASASAPPAPPASNGATAKANGTKGGRRSRKSDKAAVDDAEAWQSVVAAPAVPAAAAAAVPVARHAEPITAPVTAPVITPVGAPGAPGALVPFDPAAQTQTGPSRTRLVAAPKPKAIVRWRRRRPRVRRVSRVVRRIDAWTVFKVSVIFYVVLFAVLLVAGVLLWNLAITTGTVGNVEGFIKDLFGLKTFKFDGAKIFRASWLLGVVLVVAGTGFNVTMAVVFNLIADLVGGVRVTVLEEEVVLRERPTVLAPAPEPTVDAATAPASTL
jgi:hypothetical protein